MPESVQDRPEDTVRRLEETIAWNIWRLQRNPIPALVTTINQKISDDLHRRERLLERCA